jgi:hypothetical protein
MRFDLMHFLSINVYDHPTGFTFDPSAVVQRLQGYFPEAWVDPRDQLEIRARSDQAKFDASSPGMRAAIEAMWREAWNQGPAYSFTIPSPGRGALKGVVKRHMVQVGFSSQVDEGLLERVREFLASLVPESVGVAIEQD